MIISSKLPFITAIRHFGCDFWLMIDVIKVKSKAFPFHKLYLQKLLDVFMKGSVQLSERLLVCSDALDKYLKAFSKFYDRLSEIIDIVGVRTDFVRALRG